jgi:hypothetical protein
MAGEEGTMGKRLVTDPRQRAAWRQVTERIDRARKQREIREQPVRLPGRRPRHGQGQDRELA